MTHQNPQRSNHTTTELGAELEEEGLSCSFVVLKKKKSDIAQVVQSGLRSRVSLSSSLLQLLQCQPLEWDYITGLPASTTHSQAVLELEPSAYGILGLSSTCLLNYICSTVLRQ